MEQGETRGYIQEQTGIARVRHLGCELEECQRDAVHHDPLPFDVAFDNDNGWAHGGDAAGAHADAHTSFDRAGRGGDRLIVFDDRAHSLVRPERLDALQ